MTTNNAATRGPDPKIIDLINDESANGSRLSLEFFPPRTETGVKNLYARMDRMLTTTKPLFTDVTWGAGGSTAGLSLEIAQYAHNTGHTSNMHLTCTNMGGDDPIGAVRDALQSAHDSGIRNIVALRGDPPEGQDTWTAAEGGFTCALDLVKFIRKEFGDTFGVSVAGYPEGHPNAISEIADPSTLSESELARSSNFDGITYTCKDDDYKKEMDYLKQKVDAGADFIITQMFFDVKVFEQFCKDCLDWGITVPVVPGLMCINAYAGFKKMTKFCKTRIPAFLDEKMESIKDDPDAVKAYGVEFGTQVCNELLKTCKVLHFYTLNLEKVVYGIMDGVGLTKGVSATTDESDAKDMVAMGSAWARVGDTVKTAHGEGIVLEIQKNGVAVVEISTTDGQKNAVNVEKGEYTKVF